MPPEANIDVTRLLIAWGKGDEAALEQLVPLVEAELRRLARHYLGKEAPCNTLQPTALVNEAYLRLIEWKAVEWQNRAHFFAVSAKMMRRILVNHAMAAGTQKRGGSVVMVSLTESVAAVDDRTTEILALDAALLKLAQFDKRKSQLVELRFFGGLSEEETAEVLKVSLRTVQRDWSLARAWLFRQLSG